MIRSLRKRSKTADDKDKANCSMTRKVIDRRMIREWIGTEQPKISHESFCLLPYRVQYRTLIPKVVVSLFALHWSTLVAIFLWISQGMPSPLSSTTSSVDDENEKDGAAEAWLQSMDWNGWVGQMAQIDVNMLLNDDKTALRQDLLDHYIGTLGVGSVLNNVVNPPQIWTIRDFRKAVIQIQETAKKFRRPPVIWGLDSVHGANYLHNTITTPQPFNLASSFNETLLYQAGRWASVDTRRAGIPWLFSPLLGLSWNPFWSRTYETFGEDPVLVGAMARAMTRGIQDTDPTDSNIIPSRAAACAKHWVGYSFPHNGHDRAPSWIPKRHLYQYFLLPWKQVLDETLTVMESYTEMDGVPNVANRQTLDRLLRRELQFDGMLVTDYHEIFNLAEWHHTAKDRNEALQKVMVEGTVDMSMIANEPDDFFAAMHNLVNTTGMKSRMESSARRVLQLKQKLNMFQESFNLTVNDTDDDGPSAEALQAALEMTHQSIVLAQNSNDALPLNPKEPLRVLVTGPTSRSLSFQTGGWTGQWQGVDSRKEDKWFTYGSTVWDAISQRSSSSEDGYEWQVTYECGVDILGHDCQDPGILAFVEDSNEEEPEGGGGVMGTIKGWVGWNGDEAPMYEEPMFSIERAMNQATSSDVIVVCVGEENYTEKPGDIRRLQLPSGQYELVAGLREVAPNAKIILLYFGGRPRLLQEIVVRKRQEEHKNEEDALTVREVVYAISLTTYTTNSFFPFCLFVIPGLLGWCGCGGFGFFARALGRRCHG